MMRQERQAHGQAATWLDLAAQQPMIRKMYGLISATGDSANRVLKRVPRCPRTARVVSPARAAPADWFAVGRVGDVSAVCETSADAFRIVVG
jgi:hypothetical protein